MKNVKMIIWDWNGTLLDDTMVCIDCMNNLLANRNKPLINFEQYRSIFTFPVKEYYEAAGFDFSKEPFDTPALQFIDLYRRAVLTAGLQPDAKDILEYFRKQGLPQAILSAMQHEFLEETIGMHNIQHYFAYIQGIGDHFGNGKAEQASILMQVSGYMPEEVIFIGDTIHDHEVALETGCEAILVANGHQSRERLEQTGRRIIKNLSELKMIL